MQDVALMELELEFMAAHTFMSEGDPGYVAISRQGEKGKGAASHREFVGMVGEDEGRCRRRILAASCEEDGENSVA
jgi:hypothetical protein